jgi:hypothetical protein
VEAAMGEAEREPRLGLRGGRGEEVRELRLGLRGGIRRRIEIDAMINPLPLLRDSRSCGGLGGWTLGVVVIAVPGEGVQGGVLCIDCPECMPL